VVGRAGSRRVGVDGKEVAVLFPHERERDGVAVARVKWWEEIAQGKLEDRGRTPPGCWAPKLQECVAWPEIGWGSGPGKTGGSSLRDFCFPKGLLYSFYPCQKCVAVSFSFNFDHLSCLKFIINIKNNSYSLCPKKNDVLGFKICPKKNDVLLNLACVHVHVGMQQSIST
jgi:hypothetical protein